MVPSNIIDKLGHSKRQANHPDVYSEETDNQAQNEGSAKHEATDIGTGPITKDGTHVKVLGIVQFRRDVFPSMELGTKSKETENTAGDKWKDRVGRESSIIHAKTFADDHLRNRIKESGKGIIFEMDNKEWGKRARW